MPGLMRALITRRGREWVARNMLNVFGTRLAIGIFAIVAFGVGAGAAVHHAQAGGFIAVPLSTGPLCYLLWLFGQHELIRLTPAGIVVENMFIRHEFSWMAAPTVYLARGLMVRAPMADPVSCQAFAFAAGAQTREYERVLRQIEKERRRIRAKYPITSDAEISTDYRARFQLPKPWLLLAALAVSEALYTLGVLAGSHSQ
jgi:hypothetical protein